LISGKTKNEEALRQMKIYEKKNESKKKKKK